ncbi:MAG TPA: DUF4091 domain-containing protein [Candidatus Brocadiia bacterium]|nr:DUF4091 domain-containing protein [Candidatus Brocadiia bacterium]
MRLRIAFVLMSFCFLSIVRAEDVPAPADPRGHFLSRSDWGTLWWREATYKIMRDAPVPSGEASPVRIEAARNEYEPVQIILSPERNIEKVAIRIEGFPPQVKWEYNLVDYVHVNTPSDPYGSRDWYPDPLPPLTDGRNMKPGRNYPFWLTAYVAEDAPAGKHSGKAIITENGVVIAEAPVELTVFDFTLPRETHTETAYGMHLNAAWHGPLNPEQTKQVWRLYVENAARHRISCYSPMAHVGPIGVDIQGAGGDAQVKLDFAQFDAAASWALDELKMTSFNFPHSIIPGEIAGHKRGSEEYLALYRKGQGGIVEHLREKGWLKKCYTYWTDEPPLKSYPSVKEGMDFIHKNLPGLRTLLTLNLEPAPLPYFYESVDIWVPVFSAYNHERARERQAKGEKVWWYVCTVPRFPFPNNFIDHPALNQRIHFWMMEKYGVDGSLYWSTTYWNYKNPWRDTMSYSRADKKGETYGNGDGYLLYPPVATPPSEPVVSGPINTIRFEMLREGLEDREYFWLLKQASGGSDVPELRLADGLITSPMVFDHDPQKLYEARRHLAGAIVRLKGVSSQARPAGGEQR